MSVDGKCAHGRSLAARSADCTTCYINDCAELTPDRCSCDEREEAALVVCPSCGEDWDSEAMGPFVTYWGEEGWQDAECSCGAKLKIKENVCRTYTAISLDKPKKEK